MARRIIGDAIVNIQYSDRGDYRGTVSVPYGRGKKRKSWRFSDLHAPRMGFGPRIGYDSPRAYDEMAESAVGFGSYYTTHNRGDDVPDWAPSEELADAISDATAWAQDDRGKYEVRRPSRSRKTSHKGTK